MKPHNASESARPYEPEKNPAIRRLTAGAIKRRKGKAVFPIATAYDAPFGQFVERAGIDSRGRERVRPHREGVQFVAGQTPLLGDQLRAAEL